MPRIELTKMDWLDSEKYASEAPPEVYQLFGVNKARDEQKRRIRIGWLGRIAFCRFLEQEGYVVSEVGDKLTVRDGKTVSVKTASRPYHSRIIVPQREFLSKIRDYYVGVSISNGETLAEIKGYATRADLETVGVYDRGEGPGFEQLLMHLRPIKKLLEQFPFVPK